eukprot:2182572-Prymnesium_polylepis.2
MRAGHHDIGPSVRIYSYSDSRPLGSVAGALCDLRYTTTLGTPFSSPHPPRARPEPAHPLQDSRVRKAVKPSPCCALGPESGRETRWPVARAVVRSRGPQLFAARVSLARPRPGPAQPERSDRADLPCPTDGCYPRISERRTAGLRPCVQPTSMSVRLKPASSGREMPSNAARSSSPAARLTASRLTCSSRTRSSCAPAAPSPP